LDWNCKAPESREVFGKNSILQGNLDPCQLYASHENIEKAAKNMCQSFGTKHIANLGHGVYPDTPLDNVKTFINTIKNHKYQSV